MRSEMYLPRKPQSAMCARRFGSTFRLHWTSGRVGDWILRRRSDAVRHGIDSCPLGVVVTRVKGAILMTELQI